MNKQELEALIVHHNKLYWSENKPEITDNEYDALVEQLKALDPTSPILSSLGQYDEIGTKVKHDLPMLSLDKCYSEDDLLKWANKFKYGYVMTPKIDGMACSIKYTKGKLSVASTRGDGSIGEDITANVMSIPSIPKTLKSEDTIEVRGEIYMPISTFNKFSNDFSNPRNAVAGTLKNKEGKAILSEIDFFAYDLIGSDIKLLSDRFLFLKDQGFNVPNFTVYNNTKDLQKGYDQISDIRSSLDYELDGVVFKANDCIEYDKAGYTSHHPKGAIAYKFQGDADKTYLRGIEWQVSRTGTLTPVGLVDPVKLSGAVVSRISLHHAGMIKVKGLTLNAEILAVRRGGVIPHLERVLTDGDQNIELPATCPHCSSNTYLDGDFLYCSDKENCISSVSQGISHFIERMEIEGMGQSWVDKLIEVGLLKNVCGLYKLNRDDLLKLENVGEIRVDGWLSSIGKSKRIELPKFLQALGIDGLGRKASDVLSSKYKTLEAIRNLRVSDIESIEGFGTLTAQAIINGLTKNSDVIDDLLNHITISNGVEREGKFKGLSFLFTGTLTQMKRADAEELVLSNGGNVASGVSKNLSYLVAGEKAGSKLDKANSLGVKVITEQQFLNMV